MDKIGIEFLSVFALPPVDFVNLAADLGAPHISTGLTAYPFNPHGYPAWSLRDDAALRRNTVAAMADLGVSISLGEGFIIRPGVDAADLATDLGLMAELGVKRINTLAIGVDLDHALDQFAALVERAAGLGMVTTLEFVPGLPVGDLPTALKAVEAVNRDDFRILIDTMHLIRSGSSAADLAAIDPDRIGYVQLCDVPLVPAIANYGEEAMFERLPPGSGELPMVDIVAVLSPDLNYSLEVPQRHLAEAGVGPHDRLGPAVEATRALLATARTRR